MTIIQKVEKEVQDFFLKQGLQDEYSVVRGTDYELNERLDLSRDKSFLIWNTTGGSYNLHSSNMNATESLVIGISKRVALLEPTSDEEEAFNELSRVLRLFLHHCFLSSLIDIKVNNEKRFYGFFDDNQIGIMMDCEVTEHIGVTNQPLTINH